MSTPRAKEPVPATRTFGRWLGSNPFVRMRQEMDEVFSHYFQPGPYTANGDAFSISADLDVSETDKDIEIKMDVPGIDRKDIDITLTDTGIMISGSRKEETEESDKNFHRIERAYGSFQRHVTLPCEVKASSVDAKLKKGVLTIKLPKSEKAKETVRKIAIKAN